MRELRLSLKRKWFDMTDPNGKTDEYREITPYWCSRFLLYRGQRKSIKWWDIEMRDDLKLWGELGFINHGLKYGNLSFDNFTHNIMTLGYPKQTDTSRIKKYEHLGIEIGYGKKEWGAEPGKLYFIIKHGKLIELEKEARNEQ